MHITPFDNLITATASDVLVCNVMHLSLSGQVCDTYTINHTAVTVRDAAAGLLCHTYHNCVDSGQQV